MQEVAALLDEGVFDMTRLLEAGMVDGLKYEDEVIDDLKTRTGRKEKDQVRGGGGGAPLGRSVQHVGAWRLGLGGWGLAADPAIFILVICVLAF